LFNRVAPDADLDQQVEQLVRRSSPSLPAAIAAGKQLFYRQAEWESPAAYQLAGQTWPAT